MIPDLKRLFLYCNAHMAIFQKFHFFIGFTLAIRYGAAKNSFQDIQS